MVCEAEVGFKLKAHCKVTPFTHPVALHGLKVPWGWRPCVFRDATREVVWLFRFLTL